VRIEALQGERVARFVRPAFDRQGESVGADVVGYLSLLLLRRLLSGVKLGRKPRGVTAPAGDLTDLLRRAATPAAICLIRASPRDNQVG
jgi:hypothetical protein